MVASLYPPVFARARAVSRRIHQTRHAVPGLPERPLLRPLHHHPRGDVGTRQDPHLPSDHLLIHSRFVGDPSAPQSLCGRATVVPNQMIQPRGLAKPGESRADSLRDTSRVTARLLPRCRKSHLAGSAARRVTTDSTRHCDTQSPHSDTTIGAAQNTRLTEPPLPSSRPLSRAQRRPRRRQRAQPQRQLHDAPSPSQPRTTPVSASSNSSPETSRRLGFRYETRSNERTLNTTPTMAAARLAPPTARTARERQPRSPRSPTTSTSPAPASSSSAGTAPCWAVSETSGTTSAGAAKTARHRTRPRFEKCMRRSASQPLTSTSCSSAPSGWPTPDTNTRYSSPPSRRRAALAPTGA